MADLPIEGINDLVSGTLKELGRNRFQQIAQNLQYYPVVSQMMKKEKVQFDEGIGIQRNLMGQLSKQARHTGIMSTDSVDIPQLMVQMSINWRHATVGWGFAYQEMLVNRGQALIFKVVKPRRLDAMISLAEDLEAKAWSTPISGDNLLPWGIPFWVVYTASTAPGSFAGSYPSGFSTLAGIDLTQTPNFKNYSCTYTAVTKADLIASIRSGHRKMGWKSPMRVADYGKGQYQNYSVYTNDTTIRSLEAVGEAQNENLGRDLAPFGSATETKDVEGTLVLRKHPVEWVPQLDDTSVFTACTNPVYFIDHATFYPVCLVGDFLRESPVIRAPNQHNVFRVFIDISYNYLCVDRRRNGVFATA